MKKLLKVAVVLLAICTMFVACVSKPVAGTEGAWKLTCYAGTMNGWNPGEALVYNSFSFTATGSDEFKFTDGSWTLTAVCAPIDALDTEIPLEGFGDTGYSNIVGLPRCIQELFQELLQVTEAPVLEAHRIRRAWRC